MLLGLGGVMKYSIVIVRTGSHILIESTLRSIKKHLTPDEIIVINHRFMYSKKGGGHHGEGVHKGILEARNNLILVLDHDILIVNNELEKLMIQTMQDKNVFCCGPYKYLDIGQWTILPGCIMIKKDLYLGNNRPFNCTGNPAFDMCHGAREAGQELVHLEMDKFIFHLGYGCKMHYYVLMPIWEKGFEQWKSSMGLNVNFEDYVFDDGMNRGDHEWLTFTILDQLRWAIHVKEPFSTLRLGDLGLRAMIDYFFSSESFDRLIVEHPDLAMPSPEVGRQLTEELIENMKVANWIDHPKLYKGLFQALYGWRGVLNRTDDVYDRAGLKQHRNPMKGRGICCSLAGYLTFAKDFELTMYDIIRGKKVIYVGPYPELHNLNDRKDLGLAQMDYYALSMSGNHEERYKVMDNFMKKYNVNDWDLVIVTGSLYGRTIIGRVRNAGGRAFDMGQGIFFNPNNIFEVGVKAIENQTYYELIDTAEKPKDNVWEDVTQLPGRG